jgi:hypothetical protein
MMLQAAGNRNRLDEFQVDFRGGDRSARRQRAYGCGQDAVEHMTRNELLHLLVGQARANGFEFRKWYIATLKLPWETTALAIETLCAQKRYYALLFSHEFASHFWKAGERITFQVPTQSFTRRKADGTIATVTRKGYTRRSARDDAWRYHLRELALAEEPLRYMRRYLRVEEDLEPDPDVASAVADAGPGLAAEKPVAARAGLSIVPGRAGPGATPIHRP